MPKSTQLDQLISLPHSPTLPPPVTAKTQAGMALRTCLYSPLTFSPPIPLRLYTLPYWSNPPFVIFDIRAVALRTERQSARMSKITNGGLDQYGAGPLEQQR